MPSDIQQFERTFADLAYAALKSRAPMLMNYLQGWQLVDSSDDETKAVGIFGFKIGDQWVYKPVFFMNGEIKGNELLYLRGQDIFVPMQENWLNYIINRQPFMLGQPEPQTLEEMGYMQPDFTQYVASPSVSSKRASDDSDRIELSAKIKTHRKMARHKLPVGIAEDAVSLLWGVDVTSDHYKSAAERLRLPAFFKDVAQLEVGEREIWIQANGFAQMSLSLAPLIENALSDGKVQVRPGVGVSGFQIQINRLLIVHTGELVPVLAGITKAEIVIGRSHVRGKLDSLLKLKNRTIVAIGIIVQPTEPVGVERVLAVLAGKRFEHLARPRRVADADVGHGQREGQRRRQRRDRLRLVPGDGRAPGIVIKKIDSTEELEPECSLRRMRVVADFCQQRSFRRDVVVRLKSLLQLGCSGEREPQRINLRKSLYRLGGMGGGARAQRGGLQYG